MTRLTALIFACVLALALIPAAAEARSARADQVAADHALQRVKDLRRGIGVRTGRELTPALAELAARRGALDASGRKQAADQLARPTDSSDPDYYGATYIGSVQSWCPSGSIYCFHWVTNPASPDAPDLTDSGGVAGVPDYIESMASVFDAVHACENGTAVAACAEGLSAGMGWQEPVPDGTSGGGTNKFDVYIKDLFTQGYYGYAAPECSGPPCPSYMVMDKDFDRFATGSETGLQAMEVTAAHEYNHVLQFGYDVFEDVWMFESTATWAEEKVYPSINDYMQYLPSWVSHTDEPITEDSTQIASPNLKIYGSAVWNHWLDHSFGGEDVIQSAWAQSASLPSGYTDSFAPDAYRKSIVDRGGTGFVDQFEDFSAATAEWRAPGNAFPDTYPDVPRDPTALVVNGSGVQQTLNHTTFKLLSVPVPGGSQSYTLTATLDSGISGAIALVGRTGATSTAGTVTTQITRLPNGGTGSVTLPSASQYGRITAVLVNADVDQNGYANGDWKFTGDNAKFTGVKVSSAPVVTTTGATSLSFTGATLNGTVNPNGQATNYWFEYGTSTAYGSTTPLTSAGSGTTAVAASVPITGLTRGVVYHYRLVASNGSGTAQGDDVTFNTGATPAAVTGSATAITQDGASLNGTVDPNGLVTSWWFEYGPTTAYGSETAHVAAGANPGALAHAAAVSGLAPNTTYHFRIVADGGSGPVAGADATFTTLAAIVPVPPATVASTPTAPGSTTAGPQAVAPLAVTLTVVRARLRAAVTKGLKLQASCHEACRVTVRLLLSAKDARRLRVRRTVASVSGKGGATLSLRVARKVARVLARKRILHLQVLATAVAPDGRRAQAARAITLKA